MSQTSVRIGPLHLELLAQLKNVLLPVNIDVIDGFTGTGEDLGRQADGVTFKPTAVLVLGRPDTLSRFAGIAEYSRDMKAFTFTVLCVAPSNYMLTQTLDMVTQALEDFQPTNCSQISVIGSAPPRSPVPSFLNPQRFAMPTGFSLSIDPSVVP